MVKPTSSSIVQQQGGQKGADSSSISDEHQLRGYKGVRKRKWGKWVSEIRLPNSRDRIWLGSYDSPEKAARAFDAALFCLRGPNANFNFPQNPPPHISAAAHHSLSPSQIRVIAARFANNEPYPPPIPTPPTHSSFDRSQSHMATTATTELQQQDTSPSSTSEGAVLQLDRHMSTTIDWSFLDVLDHTAGTSTSTAAANSDFSLLSGGLDNLLLPGEFFMPPPKDFDDHGHGDENVGHEHFSHHQSFFGNF